MAKLMTMKAPEPVCDTPADAHSIVRPSAGAVAMWCALLVVALGFGSMFIAKGGRISDFRAFYSAGNLILHNRTALYDLSVQKAVQDRTIGAFHEPMPYYHPAYEALLYAPLAGLQYRHAYLLYLLWNLLLLAACYVLLPAGSSWATSGAARTLLCFASLPVLYCLLQGQNALLVLVTLCGVWRLLAKRQDFPAGLLLGLAVFKLQLVLAIASLLVIKKGLRFAAGCLVSAGAVASLSAWLTGPQGCLQFFHLLIAATPADSHGDTVKTLFPLWPKAMPSLYGFVYACGGRFLHGHADFALSNLLSLTLLTGCVYLVRKAGSMSTAFSIAILAALLLGHHIFLYDYPVLLLPILLLRGRGIPIIVAACFAWPYILLATSGSSWFSLAAILPLGLLGFCIAEMNVASAPMRTAQTSLPAGAAATGTNSRYDEPAMQAR